MQTERPGDVPLTTRQRAWAVAIASVSAFAALWRLGTPQVLPDELVYLRAGAQLVAGGGDPNAEHPPLAKLLYGLGQRLPGDDLAGARLVAALASLTICLLLFLLVRRIAGNRAGLLAAGLWGVLPHAGGSTGPLAAAGRLDRFAMLDPVATALALGALVAGWSWLQRPRWPAAAATGLLGGLAAGAKPTGVLVLPAIAIVVLWVRRDEWPRQAAGVGIALVASLVGLALAYAPLGTAAPDAFGQLVDFQVQHAAEGHVVTVAGTTTAFPPWWSHLWFHWRDDGPWLATVLLAPVVVTPLLVRHRSRTTRQGVALLVTAFVVVFVALAISPVKLNFYRYAWWPLLVALLAIALDVGEERIDRARLGPDAIRLGATLLAFVLAGAGVVELRAIASLDPGGYQRVAPWFVADSARHLRPERQPVLLRGRPTILDWYVDRLVDGDAPVARTDDVEVANAVVLDPEITSRFPDPAADAVRDDPAWTCSELGDLTVCLRSPT